MSTRYGKVKYANETTKLFWWCAIISIIIAIFAVADYFILHRSLIGLVSKAPVILVIILILYFARHFQSGHIENFNLRRQIVERGTRCEGKIISVNIKESYDSTNDSSNTVSSLVAEYYSENARCLKRLESSTLAHTPIDLTGKKCIVFEYDGTAIIDEVEDYANKRMNIKDRIILCLVILGFVFALWICLHWK